MQNNSKEYTRFILREAYKLASKYSDDPRTQNGAILMSDGMIIGEGVNRLPNHVKKSFDRLERPKKYSFIEHAERNAIYEAAKNGNRTDGAILFCPWFACSDCGRSIIQAGISKVIGHKQVFEAYGDGAWTESINFSNEMLNEAGVQTELYDGEIGEVEILLNGAKWKP